MISPLDRAFAYSTFACLDSSANNEVRVVVLTSIGAVKNSGVFIFVNDNRNVLVK